MRIKILVIIFIKEINSLECEKAPTCAKIRADRHDNTPMQFIPSSTQLLYSKTWVYRSIHFFLIFALKHRLWVLVR